MIRPSRLAALALLLIAGGCGGPPPEAPDATATMATPATAGLASGPQTVLTPSPTGIVDSYAPAGWVDLSTVDPTILVEIRYQGSHNFVGRPIDGYLDPVCLLPEPTAQALHSVQVAALAEGYTLKVYECYRPQRATDDFLRWRDTPGESMRAEFYPSLTKRELFTRGFVASRSRHSSGTAVDLTLVQLPVGDQQAFRTGEPLVACTAPAGERFGDNSVDMGTGYDCFDALSHTSDTRISPQGRENRARLLRLMDGGGFTGYAGEWWHFELADPPDRGRYFDFPVARAALR